MSAIIDADERATAIDPLKSFCVTAPAGSGKTELLIQRYLGLLARVERPEQILAITFTRKAAAEMRERVIEALANAGEENTTDSSHQRATQELAQAAWAADHRGGWNLLHNIARINIKTIDSFCAGLTRQMPVLSRMGGQTGIRDDVGELYQEAVAELFTLVEGKHPVAADLAALMLHFDNDWQKLQGLLVDMLARRDQWQGYVGVHYSPEESEAYLLAVVGALVSDELQALDIVLAHWRTQLLQLQQYAAHNLCTPVPGKFAGRGPDDLTAWHELCDLLLTKQGTWRARITVREGFPSGKGPAAQRKVQLKQLIAELQAVAGLESQLHGLRLLPQINPGQDSWLLVLHLSRVLPVLAAQLLLVFQKHGVVDHTQVAQAALLALGDEDAPTDLALQLDYRIEHILVDEFQDTAVNQYVLLDKLTRGWGEYNTGNPSSPRTLMIVGDGMQSIYRFRGANVGLFLKAREMGFNGVALEHIQLRCNFRSDRGVVDWVNSTFAAAFPARDDLNRAQVKFHPAAAVRPPQHSPAVEMHAFQGASARGQEIAFICDQIADRASTGDTIAVLGRNRSHLQPIAQALHQLSIAYMAPDLERLDGTAVVADLMNLCRALANDADRLAWMALLRAPWCGLGLSDLLQIANAGDDPGFTPVRVTLFQQQNLEALSPDGQKQLVPLLAALRMAQEKRDRLGLRAWLEHIRLALDGPACVEGPAALDAAERFMQLLEQAEIEGVGLDVDWLARQLARRYAGGDTTESQVHLMTLHKAKGLEFDCVIIPQLDRRPRGDGRDILLWDEYTNNSGERAFLLAADDHCGPQDPTLYNYIRKQHQQKTLLEATRLLYVGCTRARSKLLLTAAVTSEEGGTSPREPVRQSLLHSIWPDFSAQMQLHPSQDAPAVDPVAPTVARLARLNRTAMPQPQPAITQEPATGSRPLVAGSHTQRSIGTVVHQALQELAACHPLPEATGPQEHARWRLALQRHGLFAGNLDSALEQVLQSVNLALGSQGAGRWILSREHREAHSEWALTGVDASGCIRDVVVDRCFIDTATGIRWIIEYKNSVPASAESLPEFQQRTCAQYREQLSLYRDILRSRVKEQLRCAVYFTALGELCALADLDFPAPGH